MSESSAVSDRFGVRRSLSDLEATFEVLTDEARCTAVEYLALSDGAVRLDALAGFIVSTTTPADGLAEDRRGMEIRLHHVHLPKMADAGLLDYNPEERTVEPTAKVDTARELLSTGSESEP